MYHHTVLTYTIIPPSRKYEMLNNKTNDNNNNTNKNENNENNKNNKIAMLGPCDVRRRAFRDHGERTVRAVYVRALYLIDQRRKKEGLRYSWLEI